MRLLILSQNYDPEPIPKPGNLARELIRRGHDVTVLTGLPNYPEGRLYPGFRPTPFRREVRDGVNVMRGFVYPYHGPDPWRRIAHYLSFVVSSTFAAMALGPFDAIYVWHPPLTVGIAAWLISRWHGVPFLYDVQDIWPESVAVSGMPVPAFAVRMMSMLERFVYDRASHVLVVTEGARRNLIGKGVPEDRVSVASHWLDPHAFDEISPEARAGVRRSLGWGDDFIVLFAGNLGLVQDLDTVTEAAGRLERGEGVRFVLLGDGVEKARLEKKVEAEGLEDRVSFLDRVPPERVGPILASADALLVTLKPSVLADLVIPTKTHSSLASGRPVIVAVGGDADRIVREAKAGVTAPPGDPSALVRAVRRLKALPAAARASMGTAGRKYAEEHFSREGVVTTYEKMLERVARSGAS